MAGVIRKGACDAVIKYVEKQGGKVQPGVREQVDVVAARGATAAVGMRVAASSPAWSCWRTCSSRAFEIVLIV